MKSLLEDVAVTLFRSMFVKFEGVTEFEDSEIGPVRKGWVVSELGEYLAVLETGSRPEGGVKDIANGVPSIGAESNVGLGKFDYSKTKFVDEHFFASMKRGHIKSFDVLLYKDGGKPGQFEPHVSIFGRGFPFERLSINEHVYRIRVKAPLTQAYRYFWLTTPLIMEEMRRRGTGVAIPGLNSTAVRELPVLVPDVDSVRRFNSVAQPIVEKVLIEFSSVSNYCSWQYWTERDGVEVNNRCPRSPRAMSRKPRSLGWPSLATPRRMASTSAPMVALLSVQATAMCCSSSGCDAAVAKLNPTLTAETRAEVRSIRSFKRKRRLSSRRTAGCIAT